MATYAIKPWHILAMIVLLGVILSSGNTIAVILFNAKSLIDYPLLATLWVAEVPIAIFLRYIFRERKREEELLRTQKEERDQLVKAVALLTTILKEDRERRAKES